MASGKNFAGWVPGEYVEGAERIVKERFGGNSSAFVADLVMQAVKGPKLDRNPNVLGELARHYHPTIADELIALLEQKKFNESRVLSRLLDALLEAMKDEEFDPRAQLMVADAKKMRKWEALGNDRVTTAALQLAHALNNEGAVALLHLNEAAGVIPRSPVTEVIEEHHRKPKSVAAADSAAGTSSRPRSRGERKDHTRPGA